MRGAFSILSTVAVAQYSIPHSGLSISKAVRPTNPQECSLDGIVPELIWMSQASENDKNFLGQLEVEKGIIYVFDKGYVNYSVYDDWTTQGAFYVTRLNPDYS